MNTITKIALASVGIFSTAIGAVALPTVADAVNPNVVALEIGGYYNCETNSYRPEFGSRLSGKLSPFFHHSPKSVTLALVDEVGGLGVFGAAALYGQAESTCEARAARQEAPAPVAQAPVAPVAPPVVAPVAEVKTWTGEVTFNGVTETATITKFNNDSSFRVTWADGHEVTYTLINGFSVKVEYPSRGSTDTIFGTWNNKTGDLVVTTDNGVTVIHNA